MFLAAWRAIFSNLGVLMHHVTSVRLDSVIPIKERKTNLHHKDCIYFLPLSNTRICECHMYVALHVNIK